MISLWERVTDKFLIWDGCWLWMGARTGSGYGYVTAGRREEGIRRAHRVVYEFWNGPIPEGLELDHLCRTPACVRPDHLEPVTHRENMRRSRMGQSTQCPRGHEFTPENTQIYRGGRKCRACFRYFNQRKSRRQTARS